VMVVVVLISLAGEKCYCGRSHREKSSSGSLHSGGDAGAIREEGSGPARTDPKSVAARTKIQVGIIIEIKGDRTWGRGANGRGECQSRRSSRGDGIKFHFFGNFFP